MSGGDVGAREGRLVVMCGGDVDKFNPIKDIIQSYSANIQLLGDAGCG